VAIDALLQNVRESRNEREVEKEEEEEENGIVIEEKCSVKT
jgi:hypothetical protein